MYVLVLGLFRLEVGVGVGVEGGYGYRQKQTETRQIMNRYIIELKRTELNLAGESRKDVCCGRGRISRSKGDRV